MATSPQPLSELNSGLPVGGATQQAYDHTKLENPDIENDWDDWLNKLTGSLEQEERHFDEIKYREGVRNQLYYEGNFFWRMSDETLEVRDLPHTDNDPFHPHNWFRYFTDLSIAAALEASPDIIIDPVSNDDHNIHAAREARNLGDYLERQLVTESFRLETEKHRQLYGGVWWYSYWSKDAGTLFVKRPVYGQVQQKGSMGYVCNCGSAGELDDLVPDVIGLLCPNCERRDQYHVLEYEGTVSDEIVDYEKERLGFIVTECVSPLQMKGDRSGDYMEGQYLRRKRLVDRDVVAQAIPWWDSRRGGGSDNDAGIRALTVVRAPHSAFTRASYINPFSNERRDVAVEQWWLEPAKYARVRFSRDIEFVGGNRETIPAYTELGKIFPNGLQVTKVGNFWLDHREESFRTKWVYIPYISVPNKSDGDSLKDMCEPQLEIIHMKSLLFLYMKARGGGAPTIIRAPLSETSFNGSPDTITRISAGFQGKLQDLYYQPQVPPADPGISQYANQAVGEMQVMSQTVSPTTTGDPSAQQMGGTGTARGMMIMNAKAQGLQGPKLMPLAFAQSVAVMQWINLYRENVHDDVPVPIKAKTGRVEWKTIKAMNLEGDIFVYPRIGSWLPRSKEERQAALQNAWAIFGEILLNPEAPRDLKREIKEVYGLDFELDETDMEERDAMIRIDEMQKLILEAQQTAEFLVSSGLIPPNPETGQLPEAAEIVAQVLVGMCPPDEDHDDPIIWMNYLHQWIKSDEGREAHPVLNKAVRLLWKAYQGIVQAAQQQEMQAMMEQQMQMEQMKLQSQQALAAQGNDAKMQGDQQKAQMDQTKMGMEMQNKQQEHQMKLEAGDHDTRNKIAQETAKASLQAALAEATQGKALPTTGHKMVPGLGGLPPQPAT